MTAIEDAQARQEVAVMREIEEGVERFVLMQCASRGLPPLSVAFVLCHSSARMLACAVAFSGAEKVTLRALAHQFIRGWLRKVNTSWKEALAEGVRTETKH